MKKLYTLTLSLVAVLFACATALSASAAGSVARQYARYATDSDLHHNTNLAKGEFKSRDAQTTVRAQKHLHRHPESPTFPQAKTCSTNAPACA